MENIWQKNFIHVSESLRVHDDFGVISIFIQDLSIVQEDIEYDKKCKHFRFDT